MKHETAGDPMTGLKWTRRTTEKIAEQLHELGSDVSANTVGKLLKQMGFSLRVNHKKLSHGSHADRDDQCTYIGQRRERFTLAGDPIVSIDTKKRELVGSFKNAGLAWTREPVAVNDHDFRSLAQGVAIPYGIYDLEANRASVFVGTSHDTPHFAVDNLEKWWRYDGKWRYPDASRLLVLADGGGSNGPRSRAWKYWLQNRLANRHRIAVTVCHYPAGAFKWNPIEHRLFSEISKNWAGRPLDSYQTVLNYLRSTTTSTGLSVKAYLAIRDYPSGEQISKQSIAELLLHHHETQPSRNYTLHPR